MNTENKVLSSMFRYLNPVVLHGLSHLETILEQEGIFISQDSENVAMKLKHLSAKRGSEHKYFYLEMEESDLTPKCIEFMELENFTFNEKDNTYIGSSAHTGVLYCINITKVPKLFVIDEAWECLRREREIPCGSCGAVLGSHAEFDSHVCSIK